MDQSRILFDRQEKIAACATDSEYDDCPEGCCQFALMAAEGNPGNETHWHERKSDLKHGLCNFGDRLN